MTPVSVADGDFAASAAGAEMEISNWLPRIPARIKCHGRMGFLLPSMYATFMCNFPVSETLLLLSVDVSLRKPNRSFSKFEIEIPVLRIFTVSNKPERAAGHLQLVHPSRWYRRMVASLRQPRPLWFLAPRCHLQSHASTKSFEPVDLCCFQHASVVAIPPSLLS